MQRSFVGLVVLFLSLHLSTIPIVFCESTELPMNELLLDGELSDLDFSDLNDVTKPDSEQCEESFQVKVRLFSAYLKGVVKVKKDDLCDYISNNSDIPVVVVTSFGLVCTTSLSLYLLCFR
jgi:hypothetical protein